MTQLPRSFTPDGKRLAYVEYGSGGGRTQIWTVALAEQGSQWTVETPEPFLKSSFADQAPSFSPDGRWLAYHSNESGTNQVYVRTFPPPSSGQGGKWQISNSGGTVPRWSRSAHELVYQMGDQIMAARYAVNGDTFVAEKPRVWIAKLGGGVGSGSRRQARGSGDTCGICGSAQAGAPRRVAPELLRRAAAARAAGQVASAEHITASSDYSS